MVLYTKFAYGSQFPGGKRLFKNPIHGCRDFKQQTIKPFFLNTLYVFKDRANPPLALVDFISLVWILKMGPLLKFISLTQIPFSLGGACAAPKESGYVLTTFFQINFCLVQRAAQKWFSLRKGLALKINSLITILAKNMRGGGY